MTGKDVLQAPIYAPLQVYSKAAILHGIHAASSPTELIEHAKRLHLTAIALTNPNFLDLGEFMIQGERQQLKTIPGTTLNVYMDQERKLNRVTLLALNRQGLEFLFHVVTLALVQKQAITPDTLAHRKPGEDILVYWHGNSRVVDNQFPEENNFYALERPTVGTGKDVQAMHRHHLDRLVVMPPVTMATLKGQVVREFLNATRGPSSLNPTEKTYLNETIKSPLEMGILYPQFPEAIARTMEHVNLVDIKLSKRPETKAKIAGKENSAAFLRKLVWQKVAEKEAAGMGSPTLRAKVEHELSLIETVGLQDFVLMCFEVSEYCHQNGIEVVVPGSASNSTVFWALGIVEIDPQSLLFERFINAERGDSLPDAEFLLAKDHVAKVASFFSHLYPEEAVRLAKVNHFGREMIRTKAEEANFSLDAEKLETLYKAQIPSNIATHASGVGLDRGAPLLKTGGGVVVSHWDAKAFEKFRHGFKIDFLSSLGVTNVQDTKEKLEQHGRTFEIRPDDPAVFDLLLKGKTTAIVYADTPHLQQVLRDVGKVWEEKSLNVVAQALALARFDYRTRELYLSNKFMKHPFAKFSEIREILAETRFVAIYQDQLLKIATQVMGLSWKEADQLRKMMSERVSWEDKTAILLNLANIMVLREYPQLVTQLLEELIVQFNSYNFVKGHALSLALLTYKQAYLETHSPVFFWAGFFTRPLETDSKSKGKFDSQVYVNEMLHQGIRLDFPPEIQKITDVKDEEKKLIVPGENFFMTKNHLASNDTYQEFRELVASDAEPKTLIRFQQKNFPVVMTHNPVEQFPPEFAFDETKTKQTIIAKVVLRRKVGDTLFVTLDGSSLINAVVSTKSLAFAGKNVNQCLQLNTFYRLDIGASRNRDDQWVILHIHPDLEPRTK